MTAKGLLLVGHGSSMPYNKELVEYTKTMIAQKATEYVVKSAFMNINEPSIEDALEEFKKEKIDALVVVPLFLGKGVHIEKDIPKCIGLSEGEKKGTLSINGNAIPLVYADPIGSDPLLADLMIKNAKQALTLI